MGYVLAVPILMVAVVLQTSFFPAFFAGIGQPELVMLLVLSWAVHAAWEEALFWVFLGGILQDLLAPAPTGTSVIALLLLVFAIKWLDSGLYRLNIVFLTGFVIFGTLVHHLVLVLVLAVIGYATNLADMVQLYTLPTIAYNLLAIVPVYFVLRWIQKRIPKPQSAWGVSSQSK
jgi:rod shape-determining protein MreD